MLIQYYGDTCFKITTKPGGRATDDTIILTNPIEKSSGFRPVQGQAEIVLLSHTIDQDALSGVKNDPILFSTPGEYASHGLTLKGLPSFGWIRCIRVIDAEKRASTTSIWWTRWLSGK